MSLSLVVLIVIAASIAILLSSKLVYRQLLVMAELLEIPPFVIATLLVAFSTSIPELFVALTSAISGEPSFALGNIIGANILGLTFIAGLVILLGRTRVDLSNHISRGRLVLTLGFACIPVFMLLDGVISRIDGLVLIALYGVYVLFSLYVRDRRPIQFEKPHTEKLGRSLVLFGAGVAVLIIASEALFQSAGSISSAFDIAPFIVGVFALSFGTTLPELAFGFRSAFDRRPELSLGDIVGSAAVNSCGILGIAAVIAPIAPRVPSVAILDGLFYVVLTVFFYLVLWKRQATWGRGSVLLLVYVAFLVFNFIFNKGI